MITHYAPTPGCRCETMSIPTTELLGNKSFPQAHSCYSRLKWWSRRVGQAWFHKNRSMPRYLINGSAHIFMSYNCGRGRGSTIQIRAREREVIVCVCVFGVAYHADGDDLLVSLWGLPGDCAWAPQVLHAQPLLLPYDVSDDVPMIDRNTWLCPH